VQPTRRSIQRHDRLARVALHAVVSVALTFPLVVHLRSALPLGTEGTSTVPLFNLWTLRWGAGHPLPFGDGYWNAPIFASTAGTFAFSEPQPLTSMVFGVVRHLGGDVAGYGLVLLLALTLNGLAAAALARRLGASNVQGTLVGVFAQVLPFVVDQLGVLQLAMLWPWFALLALLVRWLDEPEPRLAALIGLAAAAGALTCGNHTLLFGTSLVMVVPLACSRAWRTEWRARVGGAMIAIGVAVAVAGPVILAQQSLLEGRAWRRETVLSGSAELSDWWWGGSTWPGVALLALGCTGAWVGRARPAVRLFVGLAIVGFLMSFGPRVSVLGWHPWDSAADVMPGVARLRNPWRAAAIVHVALVALSAVAVVTLWSSPRRRLGRTVLVVASVAVIVGGWGGRAALYAVPEPEAAIIEALEDRNDDLAVAWLPFAPNTATASFQPTTLAMLDALDHGHTLVNGYSGFFPLDHAQLREDLRGFPDITSIDALTSRGAGYVIADPAWFELRRDVIDASEIVVLVEAPRGVLLELP
jgi:hypothetical protein